MHALEEYSLSISIISRGPTRPNNKCLVLTSILLTGMFHNVLSFRSAYYGGFKLVREKRAVTSLHACAPARRALCLAYAQGFRLCNGCEDIALSIYLRPYSLLNNSNVCKWDRATGLANKEKLQQGLTEKIWQNLDVAVCESWEAMLLCVGAGSPCIALK